MTDYELMTGVLAVILAVLAYFGFYQKGSVKEVDREGKILAACEAVHAILGPIAIGTPNKIDDIVDALLQAGIKVLKDKEGLEDLSDEEKQKMKDKFLSLVKK